MLRRLGEDVPEIADVGHYRHHELFAYRVDRRIRHLREQLMEMVEQNARLSGKACKRGVVAHRAYRLLSCFGHRTEDEFDIFERPAEAGAGDGEGAVATHIRRDNFREETGHWDVVLVHPAAVRAAAGVEGL